MRTAKALALLLVLLSGACSRAGGPETGDMTRRDPNRLTSVEILDSNSQSAYDAVRLLRPAWLRVRGQSSFSAAQPVVVYIDGVRMGGPENLAGLTIESVESLEYISALTANQRFGIDHTNGAILVDTR